jgi:predicted metalloprotease with PDZ domain
MKNVSLALLLTLSFSSALIAEVTVEYTLSLERRHDNIIDVEMVVRGLPEQAPVLALPAWNNLYMIRDFGRLVRMVEGECEDGTGLKVRRMDKQTWKAATICPKSTVFRYSVLANTSGSFSAEINQDHAFIHPALVCLYLPAQLDVAHSIRFVDVPEAWDIATGLDLRDGEYRAVNYDHLIDSPFEISPFDFAEFREGDVLYQVAVHGREDEFEMRDLVGLIRPLVRYQGELMGGVPVKRYLFIYHVSERGAGGMEHRNSTTIGLSRDAVKRRLNSAAGVTAHEFFHLWNVKRIRPEVFDRMDWSKEVYTRALWFSEGTTSYYSLLTLLRAGVIDKKQFYDRVLEQIKRLQSRPGRFVQSVEQASLETWFGKYEDYLRPENSVSYYNKGSLVSMLLDLKIRHATENRRSLDDVVRRMEGDWSARGRGFAENGIQEAIEVVSGADFGQFFELYVSGTEELPYDEVFALAGWEFYEEVAEEVELGFSADFGGQGTLTVSTVVADSAADTAGLLEGDLVREIDGRVVTGELSEMLGGLEPGLGLRLRVLRGTDRLDIRVTPETKLIPRFELREIEDASELQLRIRKGLLTGKRGQE